MKKYLLILALIFAGCSTKHFEPEKVYEKNLNETTQNKKLSDYTYKHLTFVKTKGFFKEKKEYFDENGKSLGEFIKINDDLAANGDKLLIISQKKVVKLPNLVYSATKKGNYIAVVFEDNEYGIYDLEKKTLVFKNSDDGMIEGRYIHASPIFYNDLVLFPLLTGNVAVVDLNKKQFIRNLIISEKNINDNVIFLKIVNDRLFMATPHALVLFNPNFLIHYDDDIKYVINNGSYLYIFTIDGRVVKLDTDLKKIKEIKLPYASFSLPSVCNGKIYTVEYEDYLIEIDKNLNYKVYEGDFDTDEPLKIQNCKIYNDNKVFVIE
ncbi:conserved hypothetical protein [Lebetimonas natsushimae]|uniref:Lipoprotein n=1 Tax=Lebetimonas natsushimae TaxID=1936991 RepID=A0A292YFW3_9BACT|nr:hypothetical protein [Lebetimonas natsushimae]GAX87963.1 conserved hypothetical protein [Lebetimonas natsushimae]